MSQNFSSYFFNKKFAIVTIWGIIMLYAGIVKAQVNADFSSNITTGCVPLIVTFNDLSTGEEIVEWHWKLGSKNSYIQNPQIIFDDPGVYTISLKIMASSGKIDSVTKVAYIVAYPSPHSDFVISSNAGCIPKEVAFDEESFSSSSKIENWLWDFGDGQFSNIKDPTHTYDQPGQYTVSLLVEDKNGCQGFYYLESAVNVSQPLAAFNIGGVPPILELTNLSLGDNLIYNWDFGDGYTSNIFNPIHEYPDVDSSYDVTLKVIDTLGCMDSIKKNIILFNIDTSSAGGELMFLTRQDPIAGINISDSFDFSYKHRSICGIDTLDFYNLSIIETNLIWNWGDGSSDSNNNIHNIHYYTEPGEYMVELRSYDSVYSVTKAIIVVDSVTVNFSADITVTECTPFIAEFNDSSAGMIETYRWNFGDGHGSYLQNPKHMYVKSGNYDIQLEVINPLGCKSSFMVPEYMQIGGPGGYLEFDSIHNCLEKEISFIAHTKRTDLYYWDFGDGHLFSEYNADSIIYLSHKYDHIGIYTPKLFLKDSNECMHLVNSRSKIHVNNLEADFILPDILCHRDSMMLISNTQLDSSYITYVWYVNDEVFNTDSIMYYFSDPEEYTIKLEAKDPYNCKSVKVDSLVVNEQPILLLDPINEEICASTTQHFKAVNINSNATVNGWAWSIGKDSSFSNEWSYLFDKQGVYNLNINAAYNNDLCNIDSSFVINVYDIPRADFTINPYNPSLDNPKVYFYDQAYAGFKYFWNFGDGSTSTLQNPQHTYTQAQDIVVKQIVENPAGCKDSMLKALKIAEKSFIKVPNVITPNDDYVNDEFLILNAGVLELKELSIFNRYGELIFLTDDIQSYWDGTYAGRKQNAGTYVYVIVAKLADNDEWITEKGTFSIVK